MGLVVDQMLFQYLAEMVTVDRQGDCQREHFRTAEQGPEQQLPIMGALLAHDAQAVDRVEERHHIGKIEANRKLWRSEFYQESVYPGVIIFGGIQVFHQAFIASVQHLRIHLGENIGGAIHGISSTVAQ